MAEHKAASRPRNGRNGTLYNCIGQYICYREHNQQLLYPQMYVLFRLYLVLEDACFLV